MIHPQPMEKASTTYIVEIPAKVKNAVVKGTDKLPEMLQLPQRPLYTNQVPVGVLPLHPVEPHREIQWIYFIGPSKEYK